MKAILCAYHDIGCVGLRACLTHGFEVAAVFTHQDDAGENIWFASVAELAAQHNIPVFAPDDINHPLWVARIRSLAPDILFSFYYRRMIGREILAIPPAGCLNLHGSLLPRYRGRCPVNWVLINGEQETGVTLHYMTPRPDDGDIVGQRRVAIHEEDTARTLHAKLAKAAEGLLDDLLPRLAAGNAPRVPQEHDKASYYGGRRPEDGEIDWRQEAPVIRNLVRALTRPYPGAFTFLGNQKCFVWQASVVAADNREQAARPATDRSPSPRPGTIVCRDPLQVACGSGLLQIEAGQPENGLFMNGGQLADELNLVEGMRFGPQAARRLELRRKKHVLILGADGFIGNHLSERLLDSGRYEVHGMDLSTSAIGRLLGRPGFHFREGDIAIMREWIEYHVRRCDIVLPLVAIATPALYVKRPLEVFELDFEENLRIVRYCAKYGKRIIFPSTSEVYGMCADAEFDEADSPLVLGPIRKQRWIYSCAKQMLDRVIWAYGAQKGLRFTLIRPFNWIGPRLDSLDSARIGSSRVITQFIANLVEGAPIRLVDGGRQKRCFTDVRDGIDCLFRIIENQNGRADGQIFNIGNPDNELSVRELAEMLVAKFESHPLRRHFPPFAGLREVEARSFYGPGYQDVQHRRPSIRRARTLLGWRPRVPLEESVEITLDYFLRDAVARMEHNGCLGR